VEEETVRELLCREVPVMYRLPEDIPSSQRNSRIRQEPTAKEAALQRETGRKNL
jgi:hypothetical protein